MSGTVAGRTIDGVNSLTAIAWRDLNIASITSSASNYTEGTTVNNFSHTGIDRVAGLYVVEFCRNLSRLEQ